MKKIYGVHQKNLNEFQLSRTFEIESN